MNASGFNGRQAFYEGWMLLGSPPLIVARRGHFGFEGQDMSTYPEADAKALAFVQQRAREGSPYHIEALMIAQLT